MLLGREKGEWHEEVVFSQRRGFSEKRQMVFVDKSLIPLLLK